MIKRQLENKVKQLIGKYPVVSITGPRQSGKTTLVKNLFPGFNYVSLEEIDMREFAQNDPRGFFRNFPSKTIIDEAQRVPELFSYMQTIVDSNKKAKFIISGSQSFLLSEKIIQSLAGRVAVLKLLPFSLSELNQVKIANRDFETFIFTGFYPRIYDRKINPRDFYTNYLQTYVERDVRLIKNISNLNDFIKFLKLCAGRIGQLLSLSSLANDTGISVNTAKSWLSVLEASYIIFTLKPYYKNFNKRVIKNPKLYFYDTGLASSLLGIENIKQIDSHYARGNLFENLILSELLKKRFNSGLESNIYFWRDNKGIEIDCLVDKVAQIMPIEIKSGQTFSLSFFDNINYWKKNIKESVESYIIYGGDKNIKTSDGVALPWSEIDKLKL